MFYFKVYEDFDYEILVIFIELEKRVFFCIRSFKYNYKVIVYFNNCYVSIIFIRG